MSRNCICVKWGKKYSSEEVNRLFSAVRRNTTRDVRLFCLTDDRNGLCSDIEYIPLVDTPRQRMISVKQTKLRRSTGALRKISVFDPNLIPDIDGNILCLDIDVIITGNIDPIFDYEPSMVCMPPPFKSRTHIETKGEGSVIRFNPQKHSFLYNEILTNTEETIAFSMGSEQRYTSFTAAKYEALRNFPDEWIISFNRHCRPLRPLNMFLPPKLPDGARIVCFPSVPKAKDAIHGYANGLKSTLPAPWISNYL